MAIESTPEWMRDQQAACLQGDVDMFPEPHDREAVAAAKAVCVGCTALTECLDWAIDHRETLGVWGGKSEGERRTISRKWLRNRNL